MGNFLPFAFPFGLGGSTMNQRVKVSLQLCIQLYMQLSLQQFMEGPTILVMNHICNRQMSYMSGVMMCRSTVEGIPLGEKLSTLTVKDLEQVQDGNTDCFNDNTKGLFKVNTTSCKAMGHTIERS
jgi:hypothetical protein